MEFLKNAWRNIFRRPSRSLLTILSIAIGAFSVMIIGTIGMMGEQAVEQELESLGLQGMMVSAEEQSLTLESLEQVEMVPSVASATPFLVDYTDIDARGMTQKVAVWGIDSGIGQVISMKIRYGRELSPTDIRSGARVCVVEENLAESLFQRQNVVGKSLTIHFNGICEEFTIVGVAEAGGSLFQSMMGQAVPLFVYLPYTTQQQCSGRGDFDRIAVKIQPDADPEETETMLSHQLGGEKAVKVENMNQYAGTFQQVLNIVSGVLAAIAGISLLVACLSVMTTMLCSVGERTREIGIKKSIGASSRMIVWEFLLEAALLSLAGGLAGILAGVVTGWGGCLALGMDYPFPASLAGICAAVSLIAGTVFGVYPARQAAKLRPVDALRTE